MSNDNLPGVDNPTPEIIEDPTPIEMETRDALNHLGEVIGEISLPIDMDESVWAEKLLHYTYITPTPTFSDIVDASLLNSVIFGAELIQAFKKANVMAGITVYNKTKPVSDYLHWMNHYLEQGSLYAAIQQIDIYLADSGRAALNLSPFVTDTILTKCKNDIQDYLRIPRT